MAHSSLTLMGAGSCVPLVGIAFCYYGTYAVARIELCQGFYVATPDFVRRAFKEHR